MPFNVLLTTYEMLMGKLDRPRLCRLPWRHMIIDEGHRLKSAECKLNAELKHYKARSKLLLTGGWTGVGVGRCASQSGR
jgi:SNF2 family DNA or RNA helicase